MPRVTTRTRTRGGTLTYTCQKCRAEIVPGEVFYLWASRYGGKRYQHKRCGAPKRSQLTQSLMSQVYSAIEDVEDAGDDMAAFADALESLVATAREVQEQYEQAAEAFGNAGENQERAEQLEGWIQSFEDQVDTIRSAAEALEEAKSAVDDCPL